MVIIANLKESGSSQTSVRLLGPRPIEMPFSRVYSMQAPAQESLPEGIRVDLQAILDDLSPQAQSIIIFAFNLIRRAIVIIDKSYITIRL
jgi:hypothetical protein